MITTALIYISYAYTLSIVLLCSGKLESQRQMIEGDSAILEAQDT
jgi:hypothetical protein